MQINWLTVYINTSSAQTLYANRYTQHMNWRKH